MVDIVHQTQQTYLQENIQIGEYKTGFTSVEKNQDGQSTDVYLFDWN